MKRFVCLLVVGYTLVAGSASARTWVVLPDTTGDAPTIRAGIDSASTGDTVRVMCGTYYEYDIEIKSAICLTSETGIADCVTIDADSLGRIFVCNSVDSTTHIMGFTAVNGLAKRGGGMYCDYSDARFTECRFMHNSAVDTNGVDGGGVYLSHGSPVFTDCDFSWNSIECTAPQPSCNMGEGGGVYVRYGSPQFIRCTFSHNSVDCSCGAVGGGFSCTGSCSPIFANCLIDSNTAGGGYLDTYAAAILSDCTFKDNSSAGCCVGGGMVCRSDDAIIGDCLFEGNSSSEGGGLVCISASPVVTGSRFYDNETGSWGGGVHITRSSSPTFNSCVFAGNSASPTQAGRGGGAVYVKDNAIVALTSCTLSANSTTGLGAGILCEEEACVTLDHCIIAFSEDGEAVYWVGTGSVDLYCCDLYGNEGGDWVGAIADQYGVNGNFSADPLFCEPDSQDFRLDPESPCAPTNSPDTCGLVGAGSVGCEDLAGVAETHTDLRSRYFLGPCCPNPFGMTTTITYGLPEAGQVSLHIYDARGRLVRTLRDGAIENAGYRMATWDGRNEGGRSVTSGVYFYRLAAGPYRKTRRMVFLR